jgi:phage tail-like protein
MACILAGRAGGKTPSVRLAGEGNDDMTGDTRETGGRRACAARWGAALSGVVLAAVLALSATLFVGGPTPAAAQRPGPSDGITSSRFSITIDGFEIATFSELEGINAEIAPTEYMEATDRGVNVAKLPGQAKPPTVILKRGMNGSLELWAWHEAVRQGNMSAARRSSSLTMFSGDGKPVAKYWMEKAWPSKIEVTAGPSGAMIETVTFVCEYLQRVSP